MRFMVGDMIQRHVRDKIKQKYKNSGELVDESQFHFCFIQQGKINSRFLVMKITFLFSYRCNLSRFSPFSHSLLLVHWLSMLHLINIGNYGKRPTANDIPMLKNTFGMKISLEISRCDLELYA
jgi:hypothetical protein